MRVRLACLIWVASMSFCFSECQCYESVSWQETKQERKQAKQVDNQDEKKKKLEARPEFKLFRSGKYLVVGTLKGYQAKGATPHGERKVFFHRITFQAETQIRGDYFSAIEKERRAAGLKANPNVIVSAYHTSEKADIAINDESGEVACIFVLQPVKASAMAGTIPVRILAVEVATDELLEIAKLASQAEKKDPVKPKADK